MQSSHFKPRHLFSALLAFALALTLVPMFSVSAMGAAPDPNVLDLSSPPNNGLDGAVGRFSVNATAHVIFVSGTDPITITGDGTNSGDGWSVIVTDATQINLAAGTVIKGAVGEYALASDDAGEVTISGPSSGTPPTIYGVNAHGIVAGILKITGHIGTISSTIASNGIYATGDLLIDAGATVDEIAGAECAIFVGGAVTISGVVGPIDGDDFGIYSDGDIIIRAGADVGNVSGGQRGLLSGGNVVISGTVGSITGTGSAGISSPGDVTISGKVVGGITGAAPMIAASYAVLDYTGLTLTGSDPAVSHTVTFDYGTLTPGGDTLQTAYLAGATRIPAPTAPGYVAYAWYDNPDLTGTPWNFAADTVSGSTSTLYAGEIIPVTTPSSDGGGCNAAGFAPMLLALAAVTTIAIRKKP